MRGIMKNTKFWVILFLVILLICSALTAVLFLWQGTGTVANIYQDGKLIRQIQLDTVTSPYEFTVTDENGGENVIRVETGAICVVKANCPDQVCVDAGYLQEGSAFPIVCLPHKLTITVSENGQESAVIDGAVQ